MNLPTCSFSELKHVGTLEPSKKGKTNFEGTNGLSVSTEPDAWRKINRGVTGGDTYSLTKANNSFIDYHKLSAKQKQDLIDWGVSNNLLEPVDKYEFSYYDDELEQELTYSFYSLEEAEEEADESEVKKVSSYRGTAKFAEYVGKNCIDDYDLIVVIYAIIETDHDGVYWHDNLDIYAYSAPRGVIVQNKLDSWQKAKLETN